MSPSLRCLRPKAAVGASLVAVALALANAAPAEAGMSLKQFRNYAAMPGGAPLIRSYLSGIRDGMIGLQTNLSEQGLEPTFCPVEEDITTGTTFEETVMREINQPARGEPWPGDTQLATVVAAALQSSYPCETY
ncbi:hypothetical protein CKO28_11290 [Rhodovibrio sodomensis]|uniref:Rap1a immunity protein domain-containing protein n=1 Tax=Rhodovibrio sodomensis TaxID=1088 RepID=A0ABS1DFE9_9PROT|nr:hypothetical protein [Rhodovibrio sodomensis]MBK1668614.1 hypothetical protein [Rhodovibrio sodomensis]